MPVEGLLDIEELGKDPEISSSYNNIYCNYLKDLNLSYSVINVRNSGCWANGVPKFQPDYRQYYPFIRKSDQVKHKFNIGFQ